MTVHSVFEDQVSPSLFEGINARYYRAIEVARNFVPNEQFDNVMVRNHSLIVGPRGSGKTTLLRMLHPECLGLWSHPEADRYRAQVDFSGVYVATDRVWREQVGAAVVGLREEMQTAFFTTIVTIDAMAAMLRTIELRIAAHGDETKRFRAVSLSERDTAKLVDELATGWMLSPRFLNLASLRVALRRRRIEARQRIGRNESEGATAPEWAGIPWDDALLLAIDAFEAGTGTRGELWALLFDEAELAPPPVRDAILRSTRGMDARLLVKCSLSPWMQETPLALSEQDGSVFNDFNVIRLFYGRRAESYDFSRELIRTRLVAAGRSVPQGVSVDEAVFGRSRFTGEIYGKNRRTAPAYGDGSALGQVVKDLAEADPNFREWLGARGINPLDLNAVTEKKRSETLRKARNIMVARLEFRRESGQLRSRKTVAMYAGGSTMLDICEGNPRLLLGLLLPLLEFYDGVHPIPQHLQAEALAQIADDFYALVDAIPVLPDARSPLEFGSRRLRSPYRELIDRVARFFQNEILRGAFNPQPPSTFRIPRSVSPGLQSIIGRLINVGAIVIIPDRGVKDVVIGEFDQHRMRLCYLIAAKEHLPPNVDRPVSIVRILESSRNDALPGLDEDDE